MKQFLYALTIVILSNVALASPTSVSTPLSALNRETKKMGAYLSVLGDPFPTALGINAAYNLKNFLRGHAGFGQVSVTTLGGATSSMTTIGAGVDALWPEWNLSPLVGVAYSRVFLSGSGFNVSADNVYAKLGIDWQSATGLNLGVGFNVALVGVSGSTPYVNAGWYF